MGVATQNAANFKFHRQISLKFLGYIDDISVCEGPLVRGSECIAQGKYTYK